jgi:putative Mg2+ transporter-C (MgtC) family protein
MLPLTAIVARLAWAGFLGALIGIERNIRRRPAGMRTGFCVSLGAALFTVVSVEIARRTGDASTTRIASNIVQGIGFLGAGVILRERGSIVGLTTAATIFATAAIGMAAGGGLFWVSGIGCSLTLFALVALVFVEDWLHLKCRHMLFRITTADTREVMADVHRVFAEMKVTLDNLHVTVKDGGNVVQFDADVDHRQQERIFAQVGRPGTEIEMYPVERHAE